jgi:NADH dehydrogenase subunit A (EC 1.6.5.3)
MQLKVFLVGVENQVPELLYQYLPIAVFFAITVDLTSPLVSAVMLLCNQWPLDEKMTAYECGFDAFANSRRQFDTQVYLVTIPSIIFDH